MLSKEEINRKRKELDKKYAELNSARRILDDEELKHQLITANKNIGKCFVFRNGYGSDDTWNLFSKIIGIENNCYSLLSFERTTRNEFNIRTRPESIDKRFFTLETKTEITPEVFNEELSKIKKELAEMWEEV